MHRRQGLIGRLARLLLLGLVLASMLAPWGTGGAAAAPPTGAAVAWGANGYRQLGDGTTASRKTPVPVLGSGGVGTLTDVVAVAAGEGHSLAVKNDRTVSAWGYNGSGQLGDNTKNQQGSPVQVKVLNKQSGLDPLSDVTAVAAGKEHSLALKGQNGAVWAWGYNSSGQLGDGTTGDNMCSCRLTPVPVAGPPGQTYLTGVVAVAAGEKHSLALKADGTVVAWGYNFYGQLGNGSSSEQHAPVQVTGPKGTGVLGAGDKGPKVVAVAAGYNHSLAVKMDTTVWAWGKNDSGQLGDGTTNQQYAPVQVMVPDALGMLKPLKDVVAVAAGHNHSLAVKSDGTVWTWGNNAAGKLGDGTTDQRKTPVQVAGPGASEFLGAGGAGDKVVAVAGGENHSLALKADGSVWAWGYNFYGQLGDGNSGANAKATTPVQVKRPTGPGYLGGVIAIAAGWSHNLAIGGPIATLSAAGLTFDQQAVGTTSAAQSFTLTNTGLGTLTLGAAQLTGATADFAFSNGCSGVALQAGQSCSVSVSFQPTDASTRLASLSIASNPPGNTYTVSLSGIGTPPPSPPPGGGSPGGPGTTYTLALSAGVGGSVTGGGSYPAVTVATLQATADAGQVFLGWTVDGAFAGWANPLTITMDGDHGVAAAFAPRPSFPDVPADHPAYEAISQLAARGVIKGYADGRFGPADATLRAQMAALIARAMGWDAEDHGNPFPDRGSVDADLWRNVGTLAYYQVARGYQDGSYKPTSKVLNAQVISFITRAMVTKGYWQAQPDDPALYPDVPANSGHRADLATYAYYAGAVPDTDPAGWGGWAQPSTRGWFALAQWQALNSYFGVDRVP